VGVRVCPRVRAGAITHDPRWRNAAFVILVIAFLQNRPRPVLPYLQVCVHARAAESAWVQRFVRVRLQDESVCAAAPAGTVRDVRVGVYYVKFATDLAAIREVWSARARVRARARAHLLTRGARAEHARKHRVTGGPALRILLLFRDAVPVAWRAHAAARACGGARVCIVLSCRGRRSRTHVSHRYNAGGVVDIRSGNSAGLRGIKSRSGATRPRIQDPFETNHNLGAWQQQPSWGLGARAH
jgi:hypothetical protein